MRSMTNESPAVISPGCRSLAGIPISEAIDVGSPKTSAGSSKPNLSIMNWRRLIKRSLSSAASSGLVTTESIISSIRSGVMSAIFCALRLTSSSDIVPNTLAACSLTSGSRMLSSSSTVSPNHVFGLPCARHMSEPPGSTLTGSPFASETTLS